MLQAQRGSRAGALLSPELSNIRGGSVTCRCSSRRLFVYPGELLGKDVEGRLVAVALGEEGVGPGGHDAFDVVDCLFSPII